MFMAVRKSALIIAKFVLLQCTFCKLRRNFGFFCSVSHCSSPLRKHIFTCDWCISIHFVCFCFSRLIACDLPLSGNNRPVFLKDFSDVLFLQVSCKNKAMSASCLLQNVHSSSWFPSLFLSSLESFSVLFLRGQAGRVVTCINSARTQMIDRTEKPIRSLQMHSAIQRIWP